MTHLILGLSMGLFGSLHCIGMCGPLILSIHSSSNQTWRQQLAYHGGRTVSYLLIGILFGWIGRFFHLFLSQQRLSLGIGILMVCYFILGRISRLPSTKASTLSIRLSQFFYKFGQSHRSGKLFFAGMGNGFLPCGLVYTAAIASMASGHIENSVIFMLGFGIGTSPILFGLVYGYHRLSEKTKSSFLYFQYYIPLILGVMLILRGINLGIPFISPAYNEAKQEVHSCCHKD